MIKKIILFNVTIHLREKYTLPVMDLRGQESPTSNSQKKK